MKYRTHLFSLFLVSLILVVVSLELSSAEPSDHLMHPEDNSDSSVQFLEDIEDQSFVPQYELAEDYSVIYVKFTPHPLSTQIYYATPGAQIGVEIVIEVQHADSSFNLNLRVELCSIDDSDSNKSESHGTIGRTIYTENPYGTAAGPFTLSNDSDAREYFVKISVRLPDDSWAIIYDENDSSFPDERLSTKDSMTIDTDGDGLSDAKEIELRTDLTNNDTDNDGLTDGSEVHNHSSDPLNIDTDGDDLNDSYEVALGTDPQDRDTDDDYLNDSYELLALGTDPQDWDTDNDGLSDGDEVNRYGTDPFNRDTDSDGLSDGNEVILGTDPFNRDTDGDGLIDGEEVDQRRDPRVPDGSSLNYGSLPLFLGVFAVAFFIVTITRRGTKR